METEVNEEKTIDCEDCQVVSVNLNRKQKRKLGSFGEPQPKWTKCELVDSSRVKVESDDAIKIGSVESGCIKSEPISSGAVWCDNKSGMSASSVPEPSSAHGTLSNIKNTQVGSDEKSKDPSKDPMKDPPTDAVFDCAASGKMLLDSESLDNHKAQERSLTADVVKDEVFNDQNDMSDLTGNHSDSECNVISIAPCEDFTDYINLRRTNSFNMFNPNFGELYNCDICEQAFLHKGNLLKHSRIHSVQKHQVCFICGAGFDGTESLKTHLVSHKGSAQMVPEDLSRYVKVHNGQHMQYVCNLCGRGYITLNNAIQHFQKHEDGYSCHICGRENITSGICTTKSDICMLARSCGELANDSRISSTFANSNMSVAPGLEVESLQTNASKKPPTKLFKCASCGNRFTNLLEFTNHKPHGYCHHVPDIPAGPRMDASIFLCDMCNRRFTDKLELDEHYASHYSHYMGDVCFSCSVCGIQFAKVLHLKHHIKVRGHQGQIYVCKQCGKTYKYRYSMENHLRKFHELTSNLEQHVSIPKDCTIQESEMQTQVSPGTPVKSEPTSCDTTSELGASNQIKCEPIDSSDPTPCTSGALVSCGNVAPKLDTPGHLHEEENQKNVEQTSKSSPRYNFSEIYNCEICEQGFLHKGNLLKHSRIHQRCGKRQICWICEQYFDGPESLKSHMAIHEGSLPGHLSRSFRIRAGTRKPLVCNLCGINFAHVASATTHLHKHNKLRYSCDICGRERLTKGICQTKRDLCMLAQNLGTGELQKPAILLYKCVLCGNRFTSLLDYSNHQKSQENCLRPPTRTAAKMDDSLHKCEFCGKRFADIHKLDVHGKFSESCGKSVGTCGHCGVMLDVDGSVTPARPKPKPTKSGTAVLSPNYDLGEIHNCDICGQGFLHEGNLVKHSRIHRNGKNLICSFCEQSFEETESLKTHMVIHDSSEKLLVPKNLRRYIKVCAERLKPYICCLCGTSYTNLPTATAHVGKHKDCFSCDVCGRENLSKGFCRAKPNLCKLAANHYETPENDTSQKSQIILFKCAYCGNCFTSILAFTNHKRSRTDCSRPPTKTASKNNGSILVCDLCYTRFTDKLQLDDHYASHCTGEVTYSCNVCERQFGAIHHLDHHMKVRGHHDQVYVCDKCGQTSNNRVLIEDHLKTEHELSSDLLRQHITIIADCIQETEKP